MVQEIKTHYWIDRGTRAIILEFTLYNGSTHLFTYVSFIIETTETGGVFLWLEIRPFRPLLSIDSLGTYAVLKYLVFVIYQIVITNQTIHSLYKRGLLLVFKSNMGCC